MSIIPPRDTRVLVQGITGRQGSFHTLQMLKYGTKIVCGVTPGKGGERVNGIEVFDAVKDTLPLRPNVSIIFVPARFAKDACMEALDAGIKILVVITEHIPQKDTIEILWYAKVNNALVIGPNTPGIIVPSKATKVGIMPGEIFQPGSVGIVSRSGTLTYEIVDAIRSVGYGISTCIGLGGDPVVGLSFIDVLPMFEKDENTKAVVLVGEIGGGAEEEACGYIRQMKKPVFAYIAGLTAPPGKRMGHAGAIIERGKGTASSKIGELKKAGALVANTPYEIAKLITENIKEREEYMRMW